MLHSLRDSLGGAHQLQHVALGPAICGGRRTAGPQTAASIDKVSYWRHFFHILKVAIILKNKEQ